jgi:hypothetical protein
MTDAAIRLVAGLAAVGLVAAPAIMAGLRKAYAWARTLRPEEPAAASSVGLGEMRVVLDLANKLRAVGMEDGVALCQQLLDVMLRNGKGSK